jgi:hypothetical protein
MPGRQVELLSFISPGCHLLHSIRPLPELNKSKIIAVQKKLGKRFYPLTHALMSHHLQNNKQPGQKSKSCINEICVLNRIRLNGCWYPLSKLENLQNQQWEKQP